MLWDAFAAVASRPEVAPRDAVVSAEATVSYGALSARATELAERLAAAGVSPGHVVLAYLENVPAFVVVMLAAAKLGATFAPLEVGLTDAEALGVLRLVGSSLVVCDPSALERCARLTGNLVALTPAGEVVSVRLDGLAAPDPARRAFGCMQFSSGSTGASKGILLDHLAFLHRARDVQRALALGEEDRTLCTLPLSHTHGAECLALPTLLGGGTLFLVPPKLAFPLYVLEELARLRITFFSTVPQFYDFAVKIALPAPPDLRALRLPFCGSAALARATAEAFYAKYGVHIRQGYGLAELSVICINQHDGDRVVYDSVGTPLPGIDWKVLGDGGEGELVVRSTSMFSGYLGDEEATKDKLRDGWLHTGDIVTVDPVDGRIRIVGRREDFIKVRGFKVVAAEVEAAIIALPWIEECAVVGEKDALGSEQVVAHVVPGAGAPEALSTALVAHLRGVLSEYKLPRACIAWSELPKNPLGKILKTKIRGARP